MIDNKTLWGQALIKIEADVSRANFGTWFKNTEIIKQEDGIIFLGVPNAFAKDWLNNKFHRFILKSLRDIQNDIRGVEYAIHKNEEKTPPAKGPYYEKTAFSDQLGLNDLYVNREDNLNPKYIFETFIVGPFNELAFAAGQAVVKNPGANYNPLFVHGGTGLGKTHLIQGVGNQIKKTVGNKKIFYTTSEKFSIDYVNSVRDNKINSFKDKYRKYDVLIMDDVQFLSNKEKTQEELFHLFNSFYENNKQIIFSSDKPPKHIPNLEERLRSRFEGGMMAMVIKPDYESRLAILKEKIKNANFAPNDEVISYVAEAVQDNIRELEGVLNSIICQSYFKKRNLSLAEAKSLVKNNIKPKKSISIKNVTGVVADFYNIEEKTLYEKTRRKEVVKPRQVVMYLLREDFNTSYPYIGQKLGGRDHTTVIYAYDKIKEDIKKDATLGQELEQIRLMLYNE